MRKWISILTAFFLLGLMPVACLAEGAQRFDGEIVCVRPVAVRAPYGGIVQDFTTRAGRRVTAGETILTLDTTAVYAPSDGIVTGLRAQSGDSAQSVMERYGALCYLESEGRFTVSATTSGAYSDEENKFVYAGETVYLKNPNATARKGEGVVTQASGSAYTIEVTDAGTLHMGDEVNVFRDAGFSAEGRIGRGRVSRADAVAIQATGSVVQVLAQEGAHVSRGDVLFRTAEGTIDDLSAVSPAVAAPADGTLCQMNAQAGMRVQKDDVLFTLHPDDSLEVRADVSEDDVLCFFQGQRVKITFDALENMEAEGEVVSVAGVPDAQTGGYSVYVSLTLPQGAREGMSVQIIAE